MQIATAMFLLAIGLFSGLKLVVYVVMKAHTKYNTRQTAGESYTPLTESLMAASDADAM
jgi:hypothetical protein